MPEFEFTFSFENGVSDWTAATADLGQGSASVASAQDQASDGSRSARLVMDNPDGTAKLWMTRALEATPGKTYTVDVALDLATADHGTVEAWRVGVMLTPNAPTAAAALSYSGDTSSGRETAGGPVWVEKTTTLLATADDEGRLFLTVALWGTTQGTRSYGLDNLRLVLTRIS